MNWEKHKLNDVCKSISDGDHQPPPKADRGIPFVTIANITNTNKFDFSDTMYVPQEYYDGLDDKRRPRLGDILYSVVGSFGIPVYLNEEQEFVFQRHIAILRPNSEKIIPKFLYYTMLSRDFYMKADAVALGAAQRTVSLTSLRGMEIDVPDIETQKKIVGILSLYDEIIANNQKQIKLLEEAAQRLYKEWFVDLKFPNYEQTEILDGIPESWERKTVGEIIGKVPRTKQIRASEYKEYGAIPVIDQSRNFIAGYTNDNEAIVEYESPVIVFGDHTRIVKYIEFPFAKGADGTQLIVSADTRMPQSLLYCVIVDIDLSNYHYARHFKYLKAENVLIPTEDVANQFDVYCTEFFKQIQVKRDENRMLSEARDRLLPKLMNGEIEV